MRSKPAVILLSGGLDSATVLAMAKAQGFSLYALSLRYGQRHLAELDAAIKIAHTLGVVQHEIIDLDLARFGGSALTDKTIDVPMSTALSTQSLSTLTIQNHADRKTCAPTASISTTTYDSDKEGRCAVAHQSENIPLTYVPARNTIMLSIALGWMEVLGGSDLFFGANAVDYSGYPDCRPDYVRAFEAMANLATKRGVSGQYITVHAPIIAMTKAEIIRAGMALGVDYSLTVSCYQADAKGRACGECASCHLRRAGFLAAGVPDPTVYYRSIG